ncbi:MAG: hypothetical protein ACRC5M_04590 [Anaeroplasmataceae bacterium]
MNKLDKVNKFTKIFFKSDEMTVKHVVSIVNYKSDEKIKSNVYEYEICDRRTRDVRKAYAISTYDSIAISNNNFNKFNTPSISNGESVKNVVGGYATIYPKDFNKMLTSIDVALDWLCKPEYEKLFTVDASGNTVGITDNKEATIARFRFGWIMFKPAVVFDKNGIGYQGVYIKSDKGIIGSLTGNEFMEFSTYMKEIMNNFYQASLELYNAGILSMILQKE